MMTEESLFVAALEKATPAERHAFLNEACAGDALLRARALKLLAAHEHNRGILDHIADDALQVGASNLDFEHDPIAEGPGDFIGPYKLKERIGEGGFGLVFVAEQQQPVRRKVALKIIKPGMDTREVTVRFEAERQALALMDHPNIARVLDAGATHSGRPYFVMELVRGVAITHYCDQQQLPTRDRLALFTDVCHAVQHAHQKGIIHRDLKPSNILVTLHDCRPVVKVIDFGVAKALNQQLTERSIYTRFAQMIGTPAYMSPEQAEMSGLDVDTRSDVYSLGVLLYELLTGSTPFDRKRLAAAGFDELRRIIREEEPETPSTRLGHSKDTLATLAAYRRTDPAKLASVVRGELDWIVMKALEKDRTRRYESASAMSRDVQRYLADEPVDASPPSSAYRARKFLRRNRGPVLAGSLILLLLVGGIVGTSVGLVQARTAAELERQAKESEARQRRLAEERKQQAEVNERKALESGRLAEERKQLAELNEKKAVEGLQIAIAVRNFLFKDLLRQAGAEEQAAAIRRLGGSFEASANPTIKELLDRAAAELTPEKIGTKFPGHPNLQASILETVGESYRAIGEYRLAAEHLSRAYDVFLAIDGPEDSSTLRTQFNLGAAYRDWGKLTEAIAIYENLCATRLRLSGPDHADTLITQNNLALTYTRAGRRSEAIELFEQVRSAQTRLLGPDHPNTLATLNNLAAIYPEAGKLAEAIEILRLVRAGAAKQFGADHPHTLVATQNLAVTCNQAGKLNEAIELYEIVRAAFVKKLGAEHPHTLVVLNNLGLAYFAAGRIGEAAPVFRQAAEGAERRNFDFADSKQIMGNLISSYEHLSQFKQAEVWRRKRLSLVEGESGQGSSAFASELVRLGTNLLMQEKYAAAESPLRQALAIRIEKEPDQWTRFQALDFLGIALLKQQKYVEAEPMLQEAFQGMKQRLVSIPPNDRAELLPQAAEALIRLYEATQKADLAAQWKQELKAVKAIVKSPAKP